MTIPNLSRLCELKRGGYPTEEAVHLAIRRLDCRDGVEMMAQLILELRNEGRVDDAFKVAEDAKFREKLFKERGMDW